MRDKTETSRSFARATLSAAAAGIVVLLVAGILLRVFVAEPARFVIDPERGRIRRPHSSRFQWQEGRARSRWGDLGLRDERPLPAAAGLRVLALGDSLTEAVEVPVEQSWPRVLESKLLGARVINAGQMAYFAGEMLRAAEMLQPRIGARVCIIALRAASFGFDDDDRVALPGYFGGRYLADGSFELLSGPAFALKRFQVVQEAKQRSSLLDVGFATLLRRLEARAPAPSLGGDPEARRVRIARRANFLFDRLGALFGDRVVVVVIDRQRYLDPTDDQRDRQQEADIEAAARAHGFAVFTTRTPFRRLFDEQRRLPVGFATSSPPDLGHLNADGHRIIADGIAPLVEARAR